MDRELGVQKSKWFEGLLWGVLGWFLFVCIYYAIKNQPASQTLPLFIPSPLIPQAMAVGRYFLALASWAFLIFSAAGAGLLALRRLIDLNSALLRLLLGLCLGLIMLSIAVWLAGMLQLYNRIFLWCLALLFASSWIQLRLSIEGVWRGAAQELVGYFSASQWWISLLIFIFIAVSGIMAFVPEIQYDSMVYHLGVPNWYLQEGGIRPHQQLLSNFPQLIEMLYLLGMALQGEITAKLIQWFLGLLIFLTYLVWSNSEKETSTGLIAALIFLSMPMTLMNWWTASADLATTLFVMLSAFCWTRFLNLPKQGVKGWLLLAGLFAGAALGSKYSAGFFIVSMVIAHLFIRIRSGSGTSTALSEAFLFGAASIAIAAPWLLKNLLNTGNPIYPFLAHLIPSRDFDLARFASFYGESIGVGVASMGDFLRLPWTLTFNDLSSLSWPGPFFLAALPLLAIFVLYRKIPKQYAHTLLVSCLSLVFILFFTRYTRYSMPYLALMAMPVGWVISNSSKDIHAVYRYLLSAVFLAVTGIHFLLALSFIHVSYKPWNVLMGAEKPLDYQSYTHLGKNLFPATSMYHYAAKILPKGSKLLILGDEKASTCPMPHKLAGIHDIPIPVSWSEMADNTEQYYERIKQDGITHIFVNFSEARRLLGYGILDWPDDSIALFCDFWVKHVRFIRKGYIPEKELKGKHPIFLYEILPQEQARLAGEPPPNPILGLYEKYKTGGGESPKQLQKKIKLYDRLMLGYPEVEVFKVRLQELKVLLGMKKQFKLK